MSPRSPDSVVVFSKSKRSNGRGHVAGNAIAEEPSLALPEARLRAYEAKYASLWLVLSIAFMCVLILEVTAPLARVRIYYIPDGLLWAAFVFDLIWRFHIAEDKRGFWRDALNWLDLVVVLSFPILLIVHFALLGVARAGRLIVIVVRLARGAALVGATASRAERFFRKGTLGLLGVIAFEVVVTLTILVWRFESVHAGYPIHSWHDSAWWAVVTLFTVGYGDLYPKTLEGRLAAVAMMFVGIALFGWITAALASTFVENEGKLGSAVNQKKMVANQADMVSQLTAIDERLERIERFLRTPSGENGLVVLDDAESTSGQSLSADLTEVGSPATPACAAGPPGGRREPLAP